MAEFIKFITEPRREFALPSVETSSKVLGAFELSEILIVKKWQKSDEVKVVLTVPYTWFAGNILPSEDPTSSSAQLSRARYFVIRDEYGEQLCYHLQDYRVMEKNGRMAKIEVSGGDARVHSETMTSAPNTSGEDWTGIRTYLLERLFRRLCNAPAEGMAAWQRLPITSLGDSMPTAEEQAQGFLPLGSIEFMELYTIGSPDPLPIAPALEELYGYLLDYEVAPVNRWGADGTESPWWKWMLRGRVSRRALFSESDGSLIINGTAGTNTQTETMSYASKDYVRARYAGGTNQGRVNLRGPWAGFVADSANPPEGANVNNFLTARARSATLRNKRVTFDFTLNFSKIGIKPIIGMSTFARIGDLVYRVNVDEIASSYSAERGWMTTAPVFLSQDSVRIASIKDGPYIEFTVNTTNTFSIPTCFSTASSFKWTVEVDGVFYGEYQGVSSFSSNGIPVNFSVPGSHTIRIYDTTGEYNIGWARAFGFSSSASGAGNAANRNKLTRVLKDPDHGHLLSAEDNGINFRSHQFYNCAMLTNSYAESMPSSVKTIRSGAYYWQYYGCTRLESASTESMGSGVETIEGNYRLGQYYGTSSLQEAAIEDCSAVLKNVLYSFKELQYSRSSIRVKTDEKFYASSSVANYFRREQFKDCSDLVSVGKEAFVANCSFGWSFRQGQFSGCYSLNFPAEEAFMTGIQNATYAESNWDRGYRGSQYSGCWSLKESAVERSNVSVTAYRPNQYSGCTSIVKAGAEASSVTLLKQDGGGRASFRRSQYFGCTSLVEAPEEAAPTVIAGCDYYRAYQFKNCVSLKKSPQEKFKKTTGQIFNSLREEQFMGCSSLSEAGAEFIDLHSTGGGGIASRFRFAQYRDCVELINPPTPSSNHTGVFSIFRAEQFMGCVKLISMQAEYSYEVSSGSLTSQYEGCVALKNESSNNLELYKVTGYMQAGFRARQFYGCSSMKYPLVEPSEPINQALTTGGREYQYANCTALLATSPEQPTVDQGGTPTLPRGAYRTGQYQNCTGLVDYKEPKLEIGQRGLTVTYGAAFRANQFQNTPATNVAGNRVKFVDGVEAIPGTNVPNDIY